jgi:hypothetical protein
MISLTTKNLSAYNGAGTESAPASETGLVTLTAVDDFYFPIPVAENASTISIHILTDGVIAGTFTVEATNLPKKRNEIGPDDVEDWSETLGEWVQINTASAGYAQGAGVGWTVTALSLAKTAGAGGAVIDLIDLATRRLRLKAVVTTGGACRVVAHGKH